LDSSPIGEHAPRAANDSQLPDLQSCRLQIEQLVRAVEPSEVREIIEAVFNSLLRLLECLSLIERYLQHVATAEETIALFQLIRDEAGVLVEFIREKGLNSPAMNEELIDILDGITFAVSHDLRRVFEPEQRTGDSKPTSQSVVAKLYRAHDLLTNCLQQSTITLTMVFAPELVGAKLFNNSGLRFRQSLQLCNDLTALLDLIEGCYKHCDQRALSSLSAAVETFRNERLECLMYSDWPQFESFCEIIKVGGGSHNELEPVLHQFRCYIETLLGQVKMRAVLADVFPVQIGAESPISINSTPQDDSSPRLQSESTTHDPFAIAV
jgi:hypothetical protein